jgi:hypothetical protein
VVDGVDEIRKKIRWKSSMGPTSLNSPRLQEFSAKKNQ